MRNSSAVLIAAVVLLLAFVLPVTAGEMLFVDDINGWLKYDYPTGAYLGKLQCPTTRCVVADSSGILYRGCSDYIIPTDIRTGTNLSLLRYPDYYDGGTGLAWGPDNGLYASLTYAGKVARFDTTTGSSSVLSLNATMANVYGLTFGPDGDLYVCANYNNPMIREVGRFRLSDGALVEKYGIPEGLTATQIISTPDGSVYVLSQCGGGLLKLNRSLGQFEIAIPRTPQSDFTNMAVSSSGDILLCHIDGSPGGKVMRYNPQTGGLSYVASGRGYNIVMVPVPEPAGIATILVGALGLVSAAKLRRK